MEKQKRKRRTYEQLLKDGYYDNKSHKPKGLEKYKIQQRQEEPQKKSKIKEFNTESYSETAEEFSERLIKEAKERGDKNWEFDFRKEYMSGQRVYFVEVNRLMKSKELLEVQLTTIYSKFMIAYVEQGEAHHISVDDADMVFFHEQDAKECYKEIKL